MTILPDLNLVHYIAEQTNLTLQLADTINDRRGAKMLKLWGGEHYFGLRVDLCLADKLSVVRFLHFPHGGTPAVYRSE